MQCRIGFAKLRNAIHIGANQIFHPYIAVAAAIAQGPAGNGTNMLLKLANIAAVLCPMTRVVHARGNLIYDQPVGGDEQLDAHHSDIIQCIEDLPRQ